MLTDKDLISKARGMSSHLSYDDELKSVVRELCYRLEKHVAGRLYLASGQKIMIFGKVRWIKSNGQSRYLTFFERIKLLLTKKDPDGIKHSPKPIRLKQCASCAWNGGQYCCNDGTDRRADEIKEFAMNNLRKAAQDVIDQYHKDKSYLSADIDGDKMEALRQAVKEAALDEIAQLSQDLGLYDDHIPDTSKMVYKPMTDDVFHAIWIASDGFNATETLQLVEAEVIKRAGLIVKEKE